MTQCLMVDDDLESRHSVRSMILDSQYHYLSIVEAETAHQGIQYLKQNQPLFLIMDLSLSDMDGFEFGNIALGLYPSLPVIILSYLKMFELVQQSINTGFSAYLLKPVTRGELLRTIDRLLVPKLSQETKLMLKNTEKTKLFEPDLGNPIETVIHYIHIKYQEQITLQEVAELVYLSPSYFSRLFKAETGITFVEYLTNYRLEKSKSMLKMTALPIEIIANSTGFTNAGYFSTTFKKVEGMTPSEYRTMFSEFVKRS